MMGRFPGKSQGLLQRLRFGAPVQLDEPQQSAIPSLSDMPASTSRKVSIVAILLCKDLSKLGNGLDLKKVCSSLVATLPGASVEVVPDLCKDLGQIPDVIRNLGAKRVVLGLCSGRNSHAEIQSTIKKAGLDPFAVEAVPLGTLCAMVHARPQATIKAHILLAGASARVTALSGSGPEDTKLHLLSKDQRVSRRFLFTAPPIGYRPVPQIIDERCAAKTGCHLCVTACLPGALSSGGKSLRLDKAKCHSCGICLAACPREALGFPGSSISQIESQIATLLNAPPIAQGPFNILFACQKTIGWLEDLARLRERYSYRWLPLVLPCLGMVTPSWVIQALSQGAGSIGFLTCIDNCALGQADVIEGRIDFCQELLSLLGQEDRAHIWNRTQPHLLAEALQKEAAAGDHERNSSPMRPLRLGSSASTLEAIRSLARTAGPVTARSLEHPHSPYGVLEISGTGCTHCLACVSSCPTGALSGGESDSGEALSYSPIACTGCGTCASVCPESRADVLKMRKETDLEALAQDRIVLHNEVSTRCAGCGDRIAPHGLIERVQALLREQSQIPDSGVSDHCPACRMKAAFTSVSR